jgi:hypothetical protein
MAAGSTAAAWLSEEFKSADLLELSSQLSVSCIEDSIYSGAIQAVRGAAQSRVIGMPSPLIQPFRTLHG